MCHIAVKVTTDSHSLYGPFMGRLLACIFEWDAGDFERLKEACGSEHTAKELARHCHRHTCVAQETKELIKELI